MPRLFQPGRREEARSTRAMAKLARGLGRRAGLSARRRSVRIRRIVGRVKIAQRPGEAVGTNDANMEALEAPWMRHAAAVRDNFDVTLKVEAIVSHSHRLVRGIQSFLQSLVVRGDAGWASIFVAFEGLDAAE